MSASCTQCGVDMGDGDDVRMQQLQESCFCNGCILNMHAACVMNVTLHTLLETLLQVIFHSVVLW